MGSIVQWRGRNCSAGAKQDGIPFGVFHRSEASPLRFLRRSAELDTFGFELFVGFFDVVNLPRGIDEAADTILVAVGREQDNACFGSRYGKLDPALLVVEGLVGENAKAEFLGVKSERALLVPDRDAKEFDPSDHQGQDASGTVGNQ